MAYGKKDMGKMEKMKKEDKEDMKGQKGKKGKVTIKIELKKPPKKMMKKGK
jgi:hypothetical protein